ncbi:EAL domain-containing protein [Actinoplanes sp. NPDC023801]|uniref:EAL domain-containing protein n=1 Tax=Actinoplanes sp. NPDC023801 TaxID=3154595 RepID=UPI0033D14AB1
MGVRSAAATRRLIAAVIVVLGPSMLLTLLSSVWEWEDVVVAGEAPEADEWLAVAAICWLPAILWIMVRLIGLHRRMQATTRDAVEAFRSTMQTVTGWVWRLDAGLRFTFSNESVEAVLGRTSDEILGAGIDAVMSPCDDQPVALDELVATAGSEWRSSVRHADGTVRYLRNSATPVYGEHSEIKAYHGFSTDITEQVLAEAEERDRYERQEAARARITDLLSGGEGLRIVLQPIVDLATQRAVGAEALSRFADRPYRPPNEWFDEAWQAGLGPDLELYALDAALARLADVPGDAYLSVNVAPETMLDPRFLQRLDRLGPSAARITVEITEHAVVTDYDALVGVVDEIHRRGARLAVDDAGAGYASMQHILRLRPDVIKLDRSIVDRADRDPARRALMAAMAAFAASLGTTVVAEGVETEEEVGVLRDAGIQLGQGYHLGRPHEDWPAGQQLAGLMAGR